MNKITRAKLNSVIKRYNNHHLIGPSQQLELVIDEARLRREIARYESTNN